MILLCYLLISIIILIIISNLNKSFSIISITPLLVFFLFNYDHYDQITYILLIFSLITIFYSWFKSGSSDINKRISLLCTPWMILIAPEITTFPELCLYSIGLRMLYLTFDAKSFLSNTKILKYETNNMVISIFLGFLVCIIAFFNFGHVNFELSSIERPLELVFNGLLIIYLLAHLDCFGSYKNNDDVFNGLRNEKLIFIKFLKLVLIPAVLLSILKGSINFSILVSQGYILSSILLSISAIYFLELNRKNYNLASFVVANYQSAIISFLYLAVPAFSKENLVFLLLWNFFFHTIINYIKKNYIEWIKFLFVVLPFLFLFINNLTLYKEIVFEMSFSIVIVFCLFIFSPLIIFNELRITKNE